MAKFCFDLKLILWKNYLLRIRSKKRLIIELLWPLVLFGILVWVRTAIWSTNKPDCHLLPRVLPSIGGFEFIQNVFCTSDNPCFADGVEGRDLWNSSIVNTYIPAVEPLFKEIIEGNNPLTRAVEALGRGAPLETLMSNNDIDPTFTKGIAAFVRLMTVLPTNRANPPQSGTDPGGTTDDLPTMMKTMTNTLCGKFTDSATPVDDAVDPEKSFLENEPVEIRDDPSASRECNKYFREFKKYAKSSTIWTVLKFVRGSIFYSPKNNFTDAVMAKVEDKFREVKGLEENANKALKLLNRTTSWLATKPSILEQLKNDSVVGRILETLKLENHDERKQVTDFLKSVSTPEFLAKLSKYTMDIKKVLPVLKCIKYDKARGYKTEKMAVDAAIPLIDDNRIWAVVTFAEAGNGSSPQVKFKIRMDSDTVETDPTDTFHDKLADMNAPRKDLKYITYGFIYIQEMVERAVAEIKTGISLENVGVYMQPFPFPCYINDPFIKNISEMFPLLMVLSWMYSAAMIIKTIVYEKEYHLKEMLRVMGVSNMTLWVAWFIDNFIVLIVSSTLLTIMLKFGKILSHSDLTLIWFFMISFVVSVIAFSFLCSTIFQNANSSGAAGGITFFLTYLPYALAENFLRRRVITWPPILPACLLSNVAFGFGCLAFARKEGDGVGMQWSDLGNETDDVDLFYVLIMLWVDSLLYFVLTLYVEAVTPGSGIPKPWNFLFLKSTYCKNRNGEHTSRNIHSNNLDTHTDAAQVMVEPVPENSISGVEVRNLSKIYSNGFVALRNLNLDFYENQITSFLGHNGAGKTTTISILTGLFPPTKGTASINGFDIVKDTINARKTIGICPQYNIVYEKLTVSEHIKLFSGLKGKGMQVTKEELEEILLQLGIPEKANEFPGNLSGGMKRKLCVAIAFSGGSKTVFLDEPTSGVDPYSRRAIWELLLKYKSGRTIILTTHFMDEAEVLGDRIAIISRGTLKACGSSLYLKTSFGRGYSLHLVRQRQEIMRHSRSDSIPEETTDAEDKVIRGSGRAIKKFVKLLVPDAVLISKVGTEVAFVLPYSSVSLFAKLFNELDSNMQQLEISSYGISDTSLEDVFLKITTEDLEQSEVKSSKRKCCCDCCSRNKSLDADEPHKPKNKSVKINEALEFHQSVSQTRSNENFVKIERSDSGGVNPNETKSLEMDVPPAVLTSNDGPGLVASQIESNVTMLSSNYALGLYEQDSTRRPAFLYGKQIFAIIVKRFTNSKRSLKSLFFEIMLPTLFVLAALIFTSVNPEPKASLPLEITPYKYEKPLEVFISEKPNNLSSNSPNEIPLGNPYFLRLIDQLVGPNGLGTECLKPQSNFGAEICRRNKYSKAKVEDFHRVRSKLLENDVRLGSCSCFTGTQKCPAKVEGTAPPTLQTHMKLTIKDVSMFPLSKWIIRTYFKYFWNRKGGYRFEVREPYSVNITRFLHLLDLASRNLTNGSTDDSTNSTVESSDKPINSIRIWFHNKAWISPLAYLNSLHNMVLRDLSPENDRDRSGLLLVQHPLGLSDKQIRKRASSNAIMSQVLSICMINALSFVPASFVLYLIQERVCGGKHLHLAAGVKPIVYWLANYIYDMCKFLIPVLITILLFLAFDTEAFISSKAILAFTTLLVLYGWAVIPLMYPASFIFSEPSTAIVVMACGNLFIGMITTVSEFIVSGLPGSPDLKEAGKILTHIYKIFPQFCLGKGMTILVTQNLISKYTASVSPHGVEKNRMHWDVLGQYYVSLFIEGIVFFMLNLLLDYRFWVYTLIFKPKSKLSGDLFEEEDVDVRTERDLVMSNNFDPNSSLVAKWLTKYYHGKKTPSVNGITFAMNPGECFGLLGINGAGKTTTFKMLTGDVKPSGGQASIMGYDVVMQRDKARKHFGYCPQEDGLDFFLTSTEMLKLYGSLRGMSRRQWTHASEILIQALGLGRYARRRCGTYSGGNKRKLSTAIALIGDPDVVFLDEPTSGMDPGARRQFWKVILFLVEMQKSVVLTSHSMEECEALCTRLGIMVNGKFECLGSPQHLKNRFGSGYMLTVRCLEENQQDFFKVMDDRMAFAKLDNSHCSQLKYKIAQEDAKLSDVFKVMFEAKDAKLIEDYSVSQTTLDDIFVKFASHQA